MNDSHRRVCLGLTALAVGSVAWAAIAWTGAHRAESRLAGEQAMLEALRETFAERSATVGNASPTLPRTQHWELPQDPEVTGTMQALELAALTAAVRYESVRALPATTAGRQSFQVAGTAGPTALAVLLAAIETDARLLVPEKVLVLPDGEQLAFEVTVATFHETEAGR